MRRILALAMATGLLLAACSSDDSLQSAVTMAAATGADGGGEAADARAPDETQTVAFDVAVADERQVIRNATLELRAEDTREAFDEIVAMVESAGGFVANANVFPTSTEDEQPRVSMTLRVPSEDLNVTMDAIKDSVDEVVAESRGAEDVTEQFIDLEARLTNLAALETELRALLEEVRMQDDADPEKLLAVFEELSSVRGQIEQLQGQINYLEDATSLATLQVELTQTPSTAPLVAQTWAPVETVRSALGNLVDGLQGVADWLINFVVFALPMLLITVGPIVVIGLVVYRRFFRKRSSELTPAKS